VEAVEWNIINNDFNNPNNWTQDNLGSGFAEINPAGQLYLSATVVGDSNTGGVYQIVPGGFPDNYGTMSANFTRSFEL